jgi:predicted transcriptional regulator
MKLSTVAILAIRGHKGMKKKIAALLRVSEATVYNYLASNNDNLTKAAITDLIQKETGLSINQIVIAEDKKEEAEIQK